MPDNSEKYKETIDDIYRQTKTDLWTREFATLILLLFAVLFLTLIVNVVFFSFGSLLITSVIYLAEIGAPLAVLYLHQRKICHAVREKLSAMEDANPGIIEAFDERRAKINRPRRG